MKHAVVWLCAVTVIEAFTIVPRHRQYHPHSTTVVTAKKAKKKATTKKTTSAGGGFGVATKTKQETVFEKALAAKTKEVQSTPSNPQSWLELGSVLVKLGDYAEAEQVFQLGNQATKASHEYLNGAHLALSGHSQHYYHFEKDEDTTSEPSTTSITDDFDVYEINQPIEDFRTVEWTSRKHTPYIHVSQTPLIPPDECAKAIQIAEDYANANGGWTSSRHTEAATTDIPIKDIPNLLEWFNDKLQHYLFPMLASRYPNEITNIQDLRVHDAFIVKYNDQAQNSLAMHTDESAFSFTIALNDYTSDYQGGGTCFTSIRLQKSGQDFGPMTLNAKTGGVVAFPGTILHGGSPVTQGTRYIIPLFCYLHENKSGNDKGYVANQLLEAVEKAQSRQKMMGAF